jgi:general L-amino acid transport system permease protein
MNTTTPNSAQSLPPSNHVGVKSWLRTHLFSSPLNILITVLLAWFLIMAVQAVLEWAFIKAIFSAASAQECRASEGAC